MNVVDCSAHPETTTIETTDEDGNPTTTEITETVLVIELTHKTPDETAADYHFTTRQNTYLQLLQDPQYEELWAELLGGFAQGGGELMTPEAPVLRQAPCNGRCLLRVRSPRNSASRGPHHR